MIFCIKLLATVLGFVFPVALIRAIGCAKEDSAKGKYTAQASICFGVLVFILMAFMPNS